MLFFVIFLYKAPIIVMTFIYKEQYMSLRTREKILNKRISVLGNGYIELIDYMGDDETVVRCARQSYGKDEDELTEEMIDKQIGRMMRDRHTSPFEQVVFQFHVKMPIFVARQWVRFRTARLNELSGRYTKFGDDDFYSPSEGSLRYRSSYPLPEDDEPNLDAAASKLSIEAKEATFADIVKKNNAISYELYDKLTDDQKIPKELARTTLPLSLMTEMYWQMDLHNLLHFLELRMEEHAQKEIREYALAIYKIVNKICPISIKHFTEYKFNSLTLGEKEIDLFCELLRDVETTVNEECFERYNELKTKVFGMAHKIDCRNSVIKPLLKD
jgi:thymidylate synthase (FAD)